MASIFTDRRYLTTEQYRTDDKLRARSDLHARYSVNRYGWFRWIMDHLAWAEGDRVLEVGCGPGDLWLQGGGRRPDTSRLTLTDLSPGMVSQAQAKLHSAVQQWAVADVQALPFGAGSSQVVIANHMLYHAPDRGAALREIRRVLGPGGRLYASTIGENHLRELYDLVRRFAPDVAAQPAVSRGMFTLQGGQEELAAYFRQVTVDRYEDALLVTETEPLVAYVLSMMVWPELRERRDALSRFIEGELARSGAIHICKESGLFTADV